MAYSKLHIIVLVVSFKKSLRNIFKIVGNPVPIKLQCAESSF